MNHINFNETGGFPLTTSVLNAVQNTYKIFNATGELAGNYTIISGCEEVNDNVSDGVIFVNGELFNFKGGIKTTNIVFVENKTKRTFEDGTEKDVFFERFYQFGTGLNSIAWSRFKRTPTLTDLETRLLNITNDLTNRIESVERNFLPGEIKYVGRIYVQKGLPPNWYIADGKNGTDDLTDKFIRGTANSIGVAGFDQITLHSSNIPETKVKMKMKFNNRIDFDDGYTKIKGFEQSNTTNDTIATTGSKHPTPVTIIPKHYKALVIQYIP